VTIPSLKEQHEIAIGNALLATLGYKSGFIRHGLDGIEPDVIYSVTQRTIGIEVATAYYDDAQAKAEWQLARGISKFDSHGIAKIGSWDEPDKLISAQVQREIDDKCSKSYSGVDAAWLCIEQHAPLADVAEVCDLIPRLRIPSDHPFEKLYLGFYAHAGDGGGFRVYDITSPNQAMQRTAPGSDA
jgi:hypothetical protein